MFKNWNPVDYIVFLLVSLIIYVAISSTLLAFFNYDKDIEDKKLTSELLNTIIAIISIYVGAKLNSKK